MLPLGTDLAFSEEQALLLETATTFCREKSPIAAVRAQLATEHGFDRAVWDEMSALGWPGLTIPERFGGSGLTLAEAAVLVEPMGRHLLATPFASTQLAVQALLAGAGAELLAATLPGIAQGAIATTALCEADGDWNLAAIAATATRHGATLDLDGSKTLVPDAAAADFILASVLLDGAPALVLLDTTSLPPGRLRREFILDETRRAYRLDLAGLTAPVSSLIQGPAAFRALRDAAWLLAAAEAAGGIAGVLDVTVAYLNTRSAFGRKIGSYQALKHECAAILVGLERSRSHLYHAATLLAGNQDAEVALRMAKAESNEIFAHAGDRAVQFHGGFGFTFDCDAQLYLRRALFLHNSFGDPQHHRHALADLLLN